MIIVPRGWRSEAELEGLVAIHPAGREVAVLEYRERMRPLRKAGALLAELDPRATLASPIERLVTAEGEYAAFATLTAPGLQRDVGFVFGDDFYARISAVTRSAEHFAEMTKLVRELVSSDVQMLGVRRRRYEYTPPRGWQPLARGFVTDWLAPGYPGNVASLTVYPALPVEYAPAELLASMLVPRVAGSEVVTEKTSPLGLANGLAGDLGESIVAVDGRRIVTLACVLRDRRYAYPLEATLGDDAALRAELDRVIASVQPIPQPASTAASATPSFWVE